MPSAPGGCLKVGLREGFTHPDVCTQLVTSFLPLSPTLTLP